MSDIPHLPEEPLKLAKVIENLKRERDNFYSLAALDFSGVPLSSLKHLISVDTVFIGPEGGWTENELNLFKRHNIKLISLGANTLRAETASISVASIFLL